MTFKSFVLFSCLGVFALVALMVVSNAGRRGGKALQVDADELLHAYRFEGEKAEAKFTDKQLELTGQLSRPPAPADNALQLFSTDPDSGRVMCFFGPEEWPNVQKQVRRGDLLTVRGLCRGVDRRRNTLIVALKDCTLLRREAGAAGDFQHP
jgi:hypothetical protein